MRISDWSSDVCSSDLKVDPGMAAAGKLKFETICAACHTPAGTGNPLLGAPNLTDNVWLYGNDFNTIRDGIVAGHAGQMPAHLPLLGETRVRLAAAWVYAQTHPSRSEEHTSELQSLLRTSSAVFC